MRNVSVPRGVSTPSRPNLSMTIWRTVADQRNPIYYFEDTAKPNVLWVRLRDLDFAPASGVRKPTMHGADALVGDQTGSFRPSPPLRFLLP